MMRLFIKAYWSQLTMLVLGLILGCFFTSWFNAGELAIAKGDYVTLKAEHSEQLANTANAALARIVAANQRADSLQADLDKTEQRLSTSNIETQHEIVKNTTGRACLNARTVRLLNHEATGSQSASLPTPARELAAPDAAIASDLDVATWANTAITQYDSCRARLAALIAWHLPLTSPEEKPHD